MYLFHILFSEARKRNVVFDPSLIMTDFEPGISKGILVELTMIIFALMLSSCYKNVVFTHSLERRQYTRAVSTTYVKPSTAMFNLMDYLQCIWKILWFVARFDR